MGKCDSEECVAAESAGDVNGVHIGHGCRNSVDCLAAAAPQLFSISKIITSHLSGGVDDDLGFAGVLDNQWSGPACAFVARCAPEFFSCSFVESNDEVLPLMIPVNDHCVAMKCRRSSFPKPHFGFHVAKVFGPLQIPIGVTTVEAARTKESQHNLA